MPLRTSRANYPCGLALVSDVPASFARSSAARSWPGRALRLSLDGGGEEPRFRAGRRSDAFFDALRAALPRDGILVTDSGRHQSLARRHSPVLGPRGLIVPADLQSMGFALPVAIGPPSPSPVALSSPSSATAGCSCRASSSHRGP